MRLLRADSSTLEIDSFSEETKLYAILSHRWLRDQEEITFRDIADQVDHVHLKKGLQKVNFCKNQAVQDRLHHVWLDTCCIDKSSSQELTESINSMFRWYQQASVCYVYLHDMPDLRQLDASGETGISKALRNCEWFKRGWTLQELLAPQPSSKVRFYTSTWQFIGDLPSLADTISDITGIHREALIGLRSLTSFSVAQKMSWAAGRKTTRPEDRAYSLLGLFDVNLGVIYGEDERAFQRLQEELLRTSADDSIFAFPSHPVQSPSSEQHLSSMNLLAHSPDDFLGCGNLVPAMESFPGQFQLANKAVHFTAFVQDDVNPGLITRMLKPLNCLPDFRQVILRCSPEEEPSRIAILNLRRVRKAAITYYVRSDVSRISYVDVFKIHQQPWSSKSFGIVKTPATTAEFRRIAVVFRYVPARSGETPRVRSWPPGGSAPKTVGLSATQVASGAFWDEVAQTLYVNSEHWKSNNADGDVMAVVTLHATDRSPPVVLQVLLQRHSTPFFTQGRQHERLHITVQPRALYMPGFSSFPDVCSTRHAGIFFLIKNYRLYENRNMVLVEIETVDFGQCGRQFLISLGIFLLLSVALLIFVMLRTLATLGRELVKIVDRTMLVVAFTVALLTLPSGNAVSFALYVLRAPRENV